MKVLNISHVEFVKRDYGVMKLLAGSKTKIMTSKNVDLKILEIEAYSSTSKHFHKLSESVFYFIAGSGEIEIQNKVFQVEEGDIAIIDPGEYHQIRNTKPEKCIVIEVMAPSYSKDDLFM